MKSFKETLHPLAKESRLEVTQGQGYCPHSREDFLSTGLMHDPPHPAESWLNQQVRYDLWFAEQKREQRKVKKFTAVWRGSFFPEVFFFEMIIFVQGYKWKSPDPEISDFWITNRVLSVMLEQ